MDFDLAEIFTVGARRAWPLLAEKKLDCSFDCIGPPVRVVGDVMQMQCGLYRMFAGMVDLLESGFIMFEARYSVDDNLTCHITVDLAGSGPLVPPERVTEILAQLKVMEVPVKDAQRGLRTADGPCPNTGARLSYAGIPAEGALLRAELSCQALESEHDGGLGDAHGARVWLINTPEVQGQAWTKRLQRLGWAVSRMASCEEAARTLNADPHAWRPALIIVFESEDRIHLAARCLPPLLPDWSQLVLAVGLGSNTLRHLEQIEAMEVRIFPFSPNDLERFTLHAAAAVGHPSGETRPAPLQQEDRKLVLIVDDTPMNLIVGKGLVEAVGYDVVTAENGLEAIEQCQRSPPNAVLMDIQMPIIDGLEATRRLRALQRRGEVAPFPILATTAAEISAVEAQCQAAGMDGFIPKPINLLNLKQELRRVVTLS